MIERSFDSEWFNALCNLPEVRPFLAPGDQPLDVSAVINNPGNYALRSKHGGFILQACGAGFFSVHTQFAAEGRGAHAIEAMRAGLDFMFTRTDCMRIFSHCPDNNPAAIRLAEAGGAKPWFRNELEPSLGPGQVVAWDIFDWVVNTPALEAEGEEFHELAGEDDHPDDPTHNRAVGATVRMARGGQVRKGVLTYNLWALAAGYPVARFISDSPPTIDASGVIVRLKPDGAMEVAECLSA